jgi:hypothetical protein
MAFSDAVKRTYAKSVAIEARMGEKDAFFLLLPGWATYGFPAGE